MSVSSEQRKACIIQLLESEGKVNVLPLANRFMVSSETIRRDLDVLEREGQLRRVYGGAVKHAAYSPLEPPYAQRQSQHAEEKRAIGRAAADWIEDGSTIVIDVGTTAMELAKAIQDKQQLKVITNSVAVAGVLSDSLNHGRFRGKVTLLGGELNPEQQSISGPLCERMMEQFRVDLAFLSVGGVSLVDGITDYDANEASMSQLFARCAQRVVVLADRSKLGMTTFARILPFDGVEAIICDVDCPDEWKHAVDRSGVQWIKAASDHKKEE
ncbi:DeoR/GlpR family DNA-binding transcription regulator [Paenibacillus glycinis]|uniref:DeoR family transcriptional regulator n=1 Tax=Paenibacillus glycinis TaxID=2697035 RepID=A0ABW9XJE2_9BACL|nr:DeoR/GlpR family DNA-binding transcription regulator [Paenibacillus glycinis]NBD22719.1 DeoR family transcriptional regulator [Paenibacillus glycinis]